MSCRSDGDDDVWLSFSKAIRDERSAFYHSNRGMLLKV